jgi:hypothetical protein
MSRSEGSEPVLDPRLPDPRNPKVIFPDLVKNPEECLRKFYGMPGQSRWNLYGGETYLLTRKATLDLALAEEMNGTAAFTSCGQAREEQERRRNKE